MDFGHEIYKKIVEVPLNKQEYLYLRILQGCSPEEVSLYLNIQLEDIQNIEDGIFKFIKVE